MATLSLGKLSLRKTPKLSDGEFKELTDFIYAKTGISIPPRRKYLIENKLGKRLSELNLLSFAEYVKFLKFSPKKESEFKKLCELITINETSFFRDLKQLTFFKNVILPEIIKKRQNEGVKSITIWSAGCSSGEEPYTLGIILHEVLKVSIIGWNVKIYANDLSPAVLLKARKGIYSDYSLRTTPDNIKQKYFIKEATGYRIHPKVQKLVNFQLINLAEQRDVKKIPKSDIIFCRNVIIYFDDAVKQKVLSHFYDNLKDDGYLFLGYSESIHRITKLFKAQIKPGGIVYQKNK
ncbi:protein-glutamate O-methyltransferase CheR [Desulfothermus okinawensis JCM 13304]